jgi:PAS domain S-box-containing protein
MTPRTLLLVDETDDAATLAARLGEIEGVAAVTSAGHDAALVERLWERQVDLVVCRDGSSEDRCRTLHRHVRRYDPDLPVVLDVGPVAADGTPATDGSGAAVERVVGRVEALVRSTAEPTPTGTGEPLVVADEADRVVSVTSDAAALLGVTEAEVIGHLVAEALPTTDPDRLRAALSAVRDGEGPDEFVTDLTDRAVHLRVRAVRTGDGVTLRLHDVTDRVERDAALRRQRDRLEEFASDVAHDLRNPLTVALGRLDLLAERTEVGPENEEFQAVKEAISRADDLIGDTLRFARDSAVGDLDVVDIGGVAAASWETTETMGATVDVGSLGYGWADEEALRRLFENLFRNAVEHGGSAVHVRVGACEVDDGAVGFYVADDGPGVPEGERDRVFDRGVSTDGGGLGLAVVEQVAAAHGWSVAMVESESGGARVEVTDVSSASSDDVEERPVARVGSDPTDEFTR